MNLSGFAVQRTAAFHGLGLLVPFLFYHFRKPSWKQPATEAEVSAS